MLSNSEGALINLISSEVQSGLSSTKISADVDTKEVADALTDVAIRSVVTTMTENISMEMQLIP